MPFLTVLLVGAAQFGYLYYIAIEVAHAAHAGAAFGAGDHVSASDISGMQSVATGDASNVPGMTAAAQTSCACSDGTSSSCQPTDCSSSRMLEYVRVDTSVGVTPPFHVPGTPLTYTFKGLAVFPVQQ